MTILTPPLDQSTHSAGSLARLVQISDDSTGARVGEHTLTLSSRAELEVQLPMWLYGVLHCGQPDLEVQLPFHTHDTALEADLAAATAHQTVPRSFPVLHTDSTTTVILREGIKVAVPSGGLPTVEAGGTIDLNVPSYRRRLSPGFFLAHGTHPADHGLPVLRVYTHLTTPTAAVLAWADATGFLEDAQVRYQAKILSSSHLFPRRDALVVYLDARDTAVLSALAEVLSTHADPATSWFTRTVAPGVGVAWEPHDPRPKLAGQSFGQHRAAILSEAVLRTDGLPVDQAFTAANIDPHDVSRNLDSPAS